MGICEIQIGDACDLMDAARTIEITDEMRYFSALLDILMSWQKDEEYELYLQSLQNKYNITQINRFKFLHSMGM